MHTVSAAVVGASGYSGLELTRILSGHPRLRLTAVTSDRWAGEAVSARLPLDGRVGGLTYGPLSGSHAVEAEVVFLATPAEVSLELVPRLLARGLQVVDLSGAYRLLDAAAYPPWYGFTHTSPGLLAEARYGLPELARDELGEARLITNPGCYATAIALMVSPLVRSGLCAPTGIRVTGLSGVSGAGRKASEDYSFCEVDEDLRAYRLGKHQHVPEIEQTVERFAGACGALSFTPVLVPMRRGILATAVLPAAPGATQADLQAALAAAYAREPFVKALAPDKVQVKDVVRTNRCHVGVALDARAGVAVAVSVIDNLVKGAAGQAVQALNSARGWDETDGLALLGG
ncbi:MAG: N-acetyl-gamma-glutamyl-phosphate reductase [Anaeromyxobacter sp.]|nr:N-acetyl-gamma-glutamyl-phosphate reductase [Anaeromyxobacter sp.]MBL0276620.1 N-acetyl-gamma-glutamyl-phosphate reductase [Anaeromyxobacter sp.]